MNVPMGAITSMHIIEKAKYHAVTNNRKQMLKNIFNVGSCMIFTSRNLCVGIMIPVYCYFNKMMI